MFLAASTALLLWGGCATNKSTAEKPERGPHGTIAYFVEIETSEPGAKIEANGDWVGESPMKLKILGDRDGTFHNVGSYQYVIRAYVRQGQYQPPEQLRFKTRSFCTVFKSL